MSNKRLSPHELERLHGLLVRANLSGDFAEELMPFGLNPKLSQAVREVERVTAKLYPHFPLPDPWYPSEKKTGAW